MTTGINAINESSIGLTTPDATQRLAEVGKNEILREQQISAWAILVGQFKSPVIWLLAGASVLSAVLGEIADAIAIGVIVVLNALVGFFQEHRAERAVAALRSMTAPQARVLRDGRTTEVTASDVVPGDVLMLEAGDIIAADARLFEANALTTNEAPLTGESAAVNKTTTPTSSELPPVERLDCVFMGTAVADGTGRATVFATGMQTELGKIAHLLSTAEDSVTPLQKRLARVTQILLYVCGAIVLVVAAIGLLRGKPLFEVFLAAVSLAVAAIPEGLPAIVTVALAIGVQRMAARHVLVRKLPAVETLGCATVICTDKTGTLTTGVMTVRELSGSDHEALLDAAAACCDAELREDEQSGVGDTTEVAILVAAAAQGIRRSAIESERKRIVVKPFSSERKRMSIRRADGQIYVKGAVETILSLCSSGTEGALDTNTQMAARGLRVLAVATGSGTEEQDLHLLGLIAIADPPRQEAIEAIAAARLAGIKTVMITGDHPVTAHAIATELGIVGPGDDAEQLIHARATPEDKLKIVRAWKGQNAVVAMTGDGVNDAPALREAHIGVAMGKTGTAVAREAADIVLADDNFASIVAAVREGRGIFDNIRKTLVYLLTGNTAELLVMLVAAVAGLPFPLLPLHLLWVNLVTDGLPALALVMDPTDDDVLKRRPRGTDEPMLGRSEWIRIVSVGALEASVTLGVFVWMLRTHDLAAARTLAFATLVFGEVFRSFAARSTTRIFWEVGAFTNLRLLAVVIASIVVQFGIHYFEATRRLFQVGSLSLHDCLLSLLLGLIPVTVIEVSKLVRRAAHRRDGASPPVA